MGVCDGHGVQGHLVSNYVKVNLPKILAGMILGQKDTDTKKSQAFLPAIGASKQRNPFEIDGPSQHEDPTPLSDPSKLDFWLSNQNFRIRDTQIKEAFKKTEYKMEHKSRVDAMLSGTTCVMTFFNHDMILCANAGDSRAILISEHEHGHKQAPGEAGNFYYT